MCFVVLQPLPCCASSFHHWLRHVIKWEIAEGKMDEVIEEDLANGRLPTCQAIEEPWIQQIENPVLSTTQVTPTESCKGQISPAIKARSSLNRLRHQVGGATLDKTCQKRNSVRVAGVGRVVSSQSDIDLPHRPRPFGIQPGRSAMKHEKRMSTLCTDHPYSCLCSSARCRCRCPA